MELLSLLDICVKYGGISIFLIIIFVYMFSYLKGILSDGNARSNIIDVLSDQLDKFKVEMNEQTKIAEAARLRESAAIAEVKKWESTVVRLQEDVTELKLQLRASEANNEKLRDFVQDILKEIYRFSRKHPEISDELNIPYFK